MRSIRFLIIAVPLLIGFLLVGMVNALLAGNAPSSAAPAPKVDSPPPIEAPGYDATAAPAIRSSRRISIPFGFAPTFPLRSMGQEVLVSGHGSCTEGETFTVAVTVKHDAGGAIARGNLAQPCAGEATLQEWQLTATAENGPLSLGPAETCGFVQTDDGQYVTDEQIWCVDVRLGDYIFLPVVIDW
jgi:hypothetical protein